MLYWIGHKRLLWSNNKSSVLANSSPFRTSIYYDFLHQICKINSLMQKGHDSNALALVLRVFCIEPYKYSWCCKHIELCGLHICNFCCLRQDTFGHEYTHSLSTGKRVTDASHIVAVSVCGLWVCGRFGLWPFRFWPFRLVAFMTRNQFDYLTHWSQMW